MSQRNFDDLLELVNKRYRSEYYAKWLSQFHSQTPSDHPDSRPLLAAISFYRDSVFHAEFAKRRNDIVKQVLADGLSDKDASVLREVPNSQDYSEDDSHDDVDFRELCERFRNDGLRLELLTQYLKDYCGYVNEYCDRILVFPNSLELFMSLQPAPYPESDSRWTRFAVSFRRALKEDFNAESKVSQP